MFLQKIHEHCLPWRVFEYFKCQSFMHFTSFRPRIRCIWHLLKNIDILDNFTLYNDIFPHEWWYPIDVLNIPIVLKISLVRLLISLWFTGILNLQFCDMTWKILSLPKPIGQKGPKVIFERPWHWLSKNAKMIITTAASKTLWQCDPIAFTKCYLLEHLWMKMHQIWSKGLSSA